MDASQKTQYLRNILVIARADGSWTPHENTYIEVVRTAIGATKAQLRKAIADVDVSDVDLRPLGRLSDRVRNLEDMVGVALADGKLQDSEKQILVRAAKVVGVTQPQVNIVVAEAKNRRKRDSTRCLTCAAPLDSATKFCPDCDAPQQNQPVEFKIPTSGITVTFAESTAAGFEDALRLARATGNLQEVLKGSKKWFGCTVVQSDAATVLQIAQALKGMRNRKVFIDGKECPWNEVFGFVWCPNERIKSYDSTKYCFGLDDNQFNVWGCKVLDMSWDADEDWLSFGHFLGTDSFEFDHKRISHELEKKLALVRMCPHLRPEFIAAVLKRIPGKVKVGYGTDWDYREAYEPNPRAVEMTVFRDYDGEKEQETIQAIGVAPRGTRVAIEIINNAAKACGAHGIDSKLFGST